MDRRGSMTTPTIELNREDETVSCDGAKGRRGTIKISGNTWHSIERMDGYKWLRPGTYDATFAEWTSSTGNKSKSIRVLNIYDNRIYIHPANKPVQLAGCIAPGKAIADCGVASSKDALQEIFDELGGYDAGKRLKLKVTGTVAAGAGTKEPGDTSNIAHEESDRALMIS